ncbi:MAG TPA: uroporphyrinogen-III synthase, partial [Phycisphaerae bacterium]|nr:uroporphyrinogen-III synthase [Phycisphaerae bacterium]
LVKYTLEGRLVVRLKGGDCFIFGRGGEELDALEAAGCQYRVVPGITAAIAAGAYGGISLTDRRYASGVAFVTGHEDPAKQTSSLNYTALAGIDTVVFYMGVGHLEPITTGLIAAGRAADTPAAVVRMAGRPSQKTLIGTLGDIFGKTRDAGVEPPAVLIVGQAAAKARGWYEKLPLAGKTVLVTRPLKQSVPLAGMLRRSGAEVIETPTIEIAPPENFSPLDAAIEHLASYDWLVFTSPNGVIFFMSRLAVAGLDARALAGVKIAAVGPATAGKLADFGLLADLTPKCNYTTAGLAADLKLRLTPGNTVLLARSDIAPPDLKNALEPAAAKVDEVCAYCTRCPAELPPDAINALRQGHVDIITFTSSSTAENFVKLLKKAEPQAFLRIINNIKKAAIGPVTAMKLQELGFPADVVAAECSVAGLVAALV